MSIDPSYRDMLRDRKENLLPKVQELAREGHGPRAIGKKLGVATSTVHSWLQQVQWSPIEEPAEVRRKLARQVVARYKTIYNEAMEEWRSTRLGKQVPPVEEEAAAKKDANAKKRESPRPVGRPANCALLARAMDALRAIREIKGLDMPRQTEVLSVGGRPIQWSNVQVEDLSLMSDEELFALEARLDAECEPAGNAQEPPRLLPPEEQED